MEEDRGSSTVHNSLDAISDVVAIAEYAGGASEYGDRLVSLPPRRGGSGGAIDLAGVVVASIAQPILFQFVIWW